MDSGVWPTIYLCCHCFCERFIVWSQESGWIVDRPFSRQNCFNERPFTDAVKRLGTTKTYSLIRHPRRKTTKKKYSEKTEDHLVLPPPLFSILMWRMLQNLTHIDRQTFPREKKRLSKKSVTAV